MYAALAPADSWGSSKSTKGPEVRMRLVFSFSLGRPLGDGGIPFGIRLGADCELRERRCMLPLERRFVVEDGHGSALGRCSSSILMIAARCIPASTASTEPFCHPVHVDRTKRPVTLSSVGPPPAPCVCRQLAS